jgi:hypothetical protein
MNIREKTTSVPAAVRIREISKDLDRTIIEIDKNNKKLKELEKSKESLRSNFFSLVDEYISISGTTETQVIDIKCASRAEAESYVEENHPGWLIAQYREDQIVIEEDPSQMKFTWTTYDGYQINRTTAIIGTKFDFEKLKDFDHALFDQIVESKMVYELNEKKAQQMIEDHPELLPVLQESTKLGKIQLRMSSPKKVNDE